MQQLTGLDASFLYLETPNSPMHISGLAIYTQETVPGGVVRFKEIIAATAARVQRVASLTRKLKAVPFGLDHPYWIEDGNFDPEFHIRHVALPAPADWRQLCIMVSRIHARPLDRARPLWEMYVIEGLDNLEGYPPGCFALFTKMHHAAVDGASGMEINAAIHDLEPDVPQDIRFTQPEGEPDPGILSLIMRAQRNNLRQPLRFVSVARNTVPGFAKTFMQLRRGSLKGVGRVPKTRFNKVVSPYRVFSAVSLPLDEIKAIKNSVEGATVNDVALTIVGGAMRAYLSAHDELPKQSTVAMAPINVRDSSEKGTGGNIVSAMAVKLRSDIADAKERLIAVSAGSDNAKKLANAIGAKAMTDYTQFIPSTLTAQAARVASRFGLANQMRPLYNCVVTNVPGPQVPLYNNGARMVSYFGTGPAADGLGLFHVISSYCGQFSISATCCREMMPDPEFYQQCLQESFSQLKTATQTSGRKGAGSRATASGSRPEKLKSAARRKAKANRAGDVGNRSRKTAKPKSRAA
ncbi:MAG: wax ester/triacylglycerol synthase family O-acyltransferase [Pseudomonadota bacterium]